MIVASGGIGGNHDLVRKNWPKRMGRVPEQLLSGVPAHVDGRMIGITEAAGAHVINSDRMWHYTEGITNYDPIWPDHGIRILPGPSSLWLDATGKRLPAPLYPGFDTLGTLEYIARTGPRLHLVRAQRPHHRQGVRAVRPGAEPRPDRPQRARGAGPGTTRARRRRCRRSSTRASTSSPRTTLRELVSAMNAVPDVEPLDYATVEAEVTARDREVANRFTKDSQVTAIRAARGYLGDRFTRVVAPHRLTDPKAGPLIAVKLHILTRKSLGGLETDLDSRVLHDRRRVFAGLYAAGEAAGFGGGGVHGYRSLEGTFLGGCVFSGRAAGRAAAARDTRLECAQKSVPLLGFEDLEVGVGHLGQPAVVDAAGVGVDDRLVDRHRVGRRHRPQIVDGLGDLHPRRGRRGGQHVDRLAGREQRVAGMHQPGRVLAVADQIRDVVDHRDFRVDHRVPAADAADRQTSRR